MSRINRNRLSLQQTPIVIDLKRMFRSSHNYSCNSLIPRYEKSSSPPPYRWKVNESPPLLKRPSLIKTILSQKKLNFEPPSISDIALSLSRRPNSSSRSEKVHTKSSNNPFPTRSGKQKQKQRYYSGRTSIEQYERTMRMSALVLREDNSSEKNTRLLVPKLWKALKSNKSEARKKNESNLRGLLMKNVIQFDDTFIFNK